ncbi:MAG: PilT/PilU family type 4a pilus ATPase [Planctomycetes bacterium]|nr:PilT/PilU family type 4a pilus ATPase [Planctomycetota bacterium]
MAKLDQLLLGMQNASASDLHMVAGQKPKYRVHGQVVTIEQHPVLTDQLLSDYLFSVVTKEQKQVFLQKRDYDFAYGIEGQARFRCNYFLQRTGMGAVFRLIPSKVKTLDELNMPAVLKKLCELRYGLVLVTGPTGSGKSTTLAAMINHINENLRRHVLTIEDPLEFVHSNKKSIITHREVGAHTESFASALRSSTRQDADVVLVGEMRDLETISQALTAAAMGTLVYGTLHTNSAPKTVDRIIDVFPMDQQAQARTLLGESLRGIVAQQLLRKKDGKGRVAVNEILIGSGALTNVIREGRVEKIMSIIQAGKGEGMQSMDDALEEQLKKDTVEPEDAYLKAMDKKRFEPYLSQEKSSGGH